MGSLRAALQFLTRLPLGSRQTTARDRAWAAAWFGCVGLAIGGLLALVEHALRPGVPLIPRLVLVLMVNALLTGALHWDGLADSADGLAAGSNVERALAIMRDSRIGTYGVLALIGVLGLQASLLAALSPTLLPRALLLAPAWGRASLVVSAAISRPARGSGLGASFIAGLRPAHALLALAPVVLATAFWGGGRGLASGAAALLCAGLAAIFWRRRLGGQTGDTLGCLNQAVETATYFLFLVKA